MISAMRSVLVGVSDLDRSLTLFRDLMGLRVERDEEVAEEVRVGWGVGERRMRLVELSCAGYPFGRLRLAEYDPPATDPVRPRQPPFDMATDIGPKAIDFYVRAPIRPRFEELVAWGCEPRSEPIRWQGEHFDSEEVVLFGPDGVPLLIMVGHRHPDHSIRPGFGGDYSEVATTSVICADPDQSRRFYGELLGWSKVTDEEVDPSYRERANRLVGADDQASLRTMVFLAPGEPSGKYLLVHLSPVTGRRLTGRMRPGMLGVSLFSHDCDDLDALHRRLSGAGVEVVSGPQQVGDGRTMLVRGPNEELFEFVEGA